MILNCINWCWAFISIYMIGWGLGSLFEKIFSCRLNRVEARIAIGTAFTTVFAETFSLFYRVGVKANIVLGAIVVISLVVVKKSFRNEIERSFAAIGQIKTWKKALIVVIGLFFLAIGSSTPYLGDTYMYHIQAVEWIEKYGTVKGLGNLHFRFAYNSAYESLGALYSWSSVVGQSLHALNGFFAFLMVCYCALTIRSVKTKRVLVSDLLKIVTIIYIMGRLMSYGSADTDPLVMHCIAFVFIKWFEFIERKEDSIALFGLIAIFGVYSVTLKLSAGLIVLFVLYPLVELIKKKNWKQIIIFVAMGLIVVAPFLARNVIISGYLIYPVTSIDLFNVDWKMPKSVAKLDSDGIIMWGRGVQYMEDPMSIGFLKWLPVWYSNLSVRSQILFIVDIIALIVFVIHFLKKIVKKEKLVQEDFVMLVAVCSFVFWMQSAPLIRYGELYMWIICMVVLGTLVRENNILALCAGAVLITEVYSAINLNVENAGLFRPADYKSFSVEGHETGLKYEDGSDIIIYVPTQGAQSDYNYFPSTPESTQLEELQFRGNSLEDGFKSSRTE